MFSLHMILPEHAMSGTKLLPTTRRYHMFMVGQADILGRHIFRVSSKRNIVGGFSENTLEILHFQLSFYLPLRQHFQIPGSTYMGKKICVELCTAINSDSSV